MEPKQYDVVIIGGGTAGSNAAGAAQKAGASVAVVRRPDIWNTCVQVGCMPSKSILASAHDCPPKNFDEVMETKDAHVKRLRTGLAESIAGRGYDVFEDEAVFDEDGAVRVGDMRLRGGKYILATGLVPFAPPIPGLDELPREKWFFADDVTREVGHITDAPENLLIVGGGPVGLEMASFFAGVGTQVTVVELGDFLSNMDPEFAEELKKIASAENIELIDHAKLASVADADAGVVCSVERADGTTEERTVGGVLVAAGRRSQLDALGLEHLGLTVEKGRVAHDEKTLRASENENVYIAGDIAGHAILHFAAEEGKVAGANAALGNADAQVDYEALNMGIIFFHPPIAYVGLTEAQAKERGIEVVSDTVEFANLGRGLLEREQYGLWKVIADKESGKIIGSQIIGPRGDDLIQTVNIFMHYGATADDLQRYTPYYHPTYTEFLQSIGRHLCAKLKQDEAGTDCPGM